MGGAACTELLYDGLAFDLVGLAPGRALNAPLPLHTLGGHAVVGKDMAEACALVPGPHCAAAAPSLPVIRSQMALAKVILSGATRPNTVIWGPASLAVSPDLFVRMISHWLEGGPFPAFSLVAFSAGTAGELRSEGLSFFTGQELCFEKDLAQDRPSVMRLAARLIHELVGAEPIETVRETSWPDVGSLRLVPTADGEFVRVETGTAGL